MSQFTTQESLKVPVFSIKSDNEPNITFNVSQTEILKIEKDGFYVRGKKVPVDDREAESVYRAFREFLVWAALTRN